MDRHLLQMLEVTIGSQALGKVCHRLVTCGFVAALPKWSATRLSTHQSSHASAVIYGTFPAWRPRRGSPLGSNPESFGAIDSFQ